MQPDLTDKTYRNWSIPAVSTAEDQWAGQHHYYQRDHWAYKRRHRLPTQRLHESTCQLITAVPPHEARLRL